MYYIFTMKAITLQQQQFVPDTPEEIAWKIEQLRKLKGTCRLLTPEERRKAKEELKKMSQKELIERYGLIACVEIDDELEYKKLRKIYK